MIIRSSSKFLTKPVKGQTIQRKCALYHNLFKPSISTISSPRAYSSSSPRSSTTPTFDSVGIVGLGLMGHGICQVAAAAAAKTSNSSIIAFEPKEEYLVKGKDRISKSLSKLVSKEKISLESADQIMGSINFTTDMNELSNTDFIVEAVIENFDLKNELYSSLDTICKETTIFASNTSSLSITEMAEIMPNRLPNFLGVHFFNPVQLMKLVEVIHTKYTDPAVFDKVYDWVENDIGKVPVKCGDTPGFIVNRLLVPSLMQAMAMVDRNDATVKDIDLSMKLGAGHPMGPLHLADYIGLDTCLFIVEGWVDKFPDEPAFIVPQCLKEKVEAGDLGRKTGKGFYVWDGEKRGDPV